MDPEIKEAIKVIAAARVELTSFFRKHRKSDVHDLRRWAQVAVDSRAHILAAEELLWYGIDPNVEGGNDDPKTDEMGELPSMHPQPAESPLEPLDRPPGDDGFGLPHVRS